MLNGGREPDLEEVATRLKLPTWTLRRKLAEEGTQFRAILNDTRRDLAMTYIRDTELAFGEIAYLLGFASAEAFQRAFKTLERPDTRRVSPQSSPMPLAASFKARLRLRPGSGGSSSNA